MANQQLSITLSNPRVDGEKTPLFIEQADEDNEYTGKITKTVLVSKLLSMARPGQGYVVGNYCGGHSYSIERTVYVYLYDTTLNYTIKASYGTLTGPVMDSITYEQMVSCGLNDRIEFTYPSEGLKEWEWITETRNSMGDVVDYPSVTFDDRGVSLNKKVYGTMRVRYNVLRHRYKIFITSRAQFDASVIQNKYSSTVYAYWDGGIDWEVLNIPYNYDTHNGNCKGDIPSMWDEVVNFDAGADTEEDEYTPPKASGADKNIDYNYCTQLTDDTDDDGRRCPQGRSMHEY